MGSFILNAIGAGLAVLLAAYAGIAVIDLFGRIAQAFPA